MSRWTIEDVLASLTQSPDEAAASLAEETARWAAAHPHISMTGGTGRTYPSVTMRADTGQARRDWPGIAALYANPQGETLWLEIRIAAMCQVSPFDSAQLDLASLTTCTSDRWAMRNGR